MQPNKTILVGGLLIISVGVVNAIVKSKPITPVFAGGIGFLLLASILDLFGGHLATLATALVGLAVTTVLLVEGPALFSALSTSQAKKA